MKAMVDGVWRTDGRDARLSRRSRARALSRPGAAPTAAPASRSRAGRYHLYVSYACPFAHRTLLGRALLGLEEAISVSVLDPDWGGPDGLGVRRAARGDAGSRERSRLAARGLPQGQPALHRQGHGAGAVGQIAARPSSTTSRPRSCACSRSSSGRSRTTAIDLYPEALRAEIDRINAFVGPRINGGVYRAGFAATQEAYDAAVVELFAALDDLEEHLATRDFLVGERLTEADLRLFPTLSGSMSRTTGRSAATSGAWPTIRGSLAYTRRIHALPGIAATVKLDHVKRHYWDDHEMINRRIVPIGPQVDFATMPAARAA